MADKKEASAAAADDKQQTIEVSADKTKTVVIILIALSIVVMVATPVITIFAIKSVVASETGAAKEASKINENHNTEVALPSFQCNLAGTNASRYVKVDVVVQLSDADLKKYFEIKADDKPDGMLNKVKADINAIISSKRLGDLDSGDGKKLLADEIKNALKEIMPKDAKGTITDVFFPSIVIQ